MKRSQKPSKGQASEADDDAEEACEGNTVLYGKWQTEPLCLPHAVNGIVPRVKFINSSTCCVDFVINLSH